jgi:hypothetical protein
MSWDNIVSLDSRLWARRQGNWDASLVAGGGVTCLQKADQLWCPPIMHPMGSRVKDLGVKLPTHTFLVSKLRMCEPVSSLPHTSSWLCYRCIRTPARTHAIASM